MANEPPVVASGKTRNRWRFIDALRAIENDVYEPALVTLRGPRYKITKSVRECTLSTYPAVDAKTALRALAALSDATYGHHVMVADGRHWYFVQKPLGIAIGNLVFAVICENDGRGSAYLLIFMHYARLIDTDACEARIKEQEDAVAVECGLLVGHLHDLLRIWPELRNPDAD